MSFTHLITVYLSNCGWGLQNVSLSPGRSFVTRRCSSWMRWGNNLPPPSYSECWSLVVTGYLSPRFWVWEGCTDRTRPSLEGTNDHCDCSSSFDYPECWLHVSSFIQESLSFSCWLHDFLYGSYFVNDGQISESGTHEQLLAQRGGYYEFVQSQALSAPT